MITHYVRISYHRNYGDYVLTALDWEAMKVHPERQSEWVPVEDAVNHSDACVRAREYMEALKVLEEPRVTAADPLAAMWQELY